MWRWFPYFLSNVMFRCLTGCVLLDEMRYSLRITYLIFEAFKFFFPTALLIFTAAKLFHQVIRKKSKHIKSWRLIWNFGLHETSVSLSGKTSQKTTKREIAVCSMLITFVQEVPILGWIFSCNYSKIFGISVFECILWMDAIKGIFFTESSSLM